jgi:putative FmdB family regulatory protein
MPTYDYICDECGHQFEAFESIKADPQRVCPSCRKERLRRKIGPGAAILFKGSGFYQTDYRSESYKQRAKEDKAPTTPAATNGNGASGSSSTSSGTASKPESASSKPAGSGSST